jgi:L-ascorbate metabolism protein UlaG (beta-lactamase superfamily)
MRKNSLLLVVSVSLLAQTVALLGQGAAQTVKITPVGAKTGDFCSPDRALIFEDPTGVRILYDPATTVAGGSDPRLGDIHVILVSHAHGDHIGNAKLNQDPGASGANCSGQIPTIPTSNSNAAEIAAAKSAAVVVTGELASFLSRKIQNAGAGPVSGCPTAGLNNETVVPRNQPCTATLGYGGKRTLKMNSGQNGVQIALVSAAHGNGLPNDELSDALRSQMTTDNLSFAPGTASGYVVTFTNKLRVYLSGDTGFTSEMLTVVRDYYRVNLAVLNIGDIFTTGPEEAAFAVNRLILPRAVIPSHANEAATTNGELNAGTKTARFMDFVREAAVYPPLSGVTMEFDGEANCVAGCKGSSGAAIAPDGTSGEAGASGK